MQTIDELDQERVGQQVATAILDAIRDAKTQGIIISAIQLRRREHEALTAYCFQEQFHDAWDELSLVTEFAYLPITPGEDKE